MQDILAAMGLEIPELSAFEPRVVTGTIKQTSPDMAAVSFMNENGQERTGILPITEALRSRPWEIGQVQTLLQCDASSRPMLSAVRPGLIEALLHGVSPEVRDGRVRVMSVARRPGVRVKVAVAPTVPDLDAVAACVGRRHVRVDSIKRSLAGEQVDIVAWHPDPRVFLANALQPAKVTDVEIDVKARTALAKTEKHQMAAAVGGGGLNSLLAGRLIGVQVRIIS